MRRDYRIDVARIIGTILVILAHTNIPNDLKNIRSFDVILLVFASGMCVHYKTYANYLLKRFKRLVIPTWIMLTILFFSTWIICFAIGKTQLYTFPKILRSYLLLNDGIGYIWIVRVYLGVAIVIPGLITTFKRIERQNFLPYLIWGIIISISVLPNIFCLIRQNGTLYYYIYEIIVYALVSYLGYIIHLNGWSKKHVYKLLLVNMACFIIIIAIQGFDPSGNKYPPEINYICYGLLCSLCLAGIAPEPSAKRNETIGKCIVFLSNNSFNLYLIHVIYLSVVNFCIDKMQIIVQWHIEFVIILISSIITTWGMMCLKALIEGKNEQN